MYVVICHNSVWLSVRMAMMTMFKKMTMTTKAMMINLKMASVGARKEKVPPWMIGKRQPRLL